MQALSPFPPSFLPAPRRPRNPRAGSPVADEGVSPVLGVILMAAITVVLGATVFVIVQGFGQGADQAPTIQFVRDNLNGQLIVVKAHRPFDLTEVQVRASLDARFGYNVPPATALPANVFVALSTTPGQDLVGGDTVNFCALAGPGTVDVAVRVTNPSDIVVYQHSFTNLDAC